MLEKGYTWWQKSGKERLIQGQESQNEWNNRTSGLQRQRMTEERKRTKDEVEIWRIETDTAGEREVVRGVEMMSLDEEGMLASISPTRSRCFGELMLRASLGAPIVLAGPITRWRDKICRM